MVGIEGQVTLDLVVDPSMAFVLFYFFQDREEW